MPTGTVKWFNNAKGYGFILPENEDTDVFAHYSAIEMDGYKTLKAGQKVDFELVDGDKGKHAAHITLAARASEDTSSKASAQDSEAESAQAEESAAVAQS